MSPNITGHVSRRNYIKAGGAAAVVGLAGCSGDGGDGSDGSDGGSGGSDGANSGSGGSSVDEVVIGSHHPMTGSLSYNGTRMAQAMELAAEVKNENGGIESLDGAEVSILKKDNQGSQELGGPIANELINEGAVAMIGTLSSPIAFTATEVAENEGVPFVASVTSDEKLLDGRGLNYAYRHQPTGDEGTRDYTAHLASLAENAGVTLETCGVVWVNVSAYSRQLEYLQERFPEHGVEVVGDASLEIDASSATSQVTNMVDLDPDTLCIMGYSNHGAMVVDAMNELSWEPNIKSSCLTSTFTNADAIQNAGEGANGFFDANYALDFTNDRAVEVAERYQNTFDQTMGHTISQAYTATNIVIEAIEQAGSDDPEELNDVLSQITVEDHIQAMPPITFGESGQNENAMVVTHQVQDMDDNVVYPEEYRVSEPQL